MGYDVAGGGEAKPKGVIEVNSGHIGGDINQVNLSEKPRQLRFIPILDAILLTDKLMHEPTGNLSIVDGID